MSFCGSPSHKDIKSSAQAAQPEPIKEHRFYCVLVFDFISRGTPGGSGKSGWGRSRPRRYIPHIHNTLPQHCPLSIGKFWQTSPFPNQIIAAVPRSHAAPARGGATDKTGKIDCCEAIYKCWSYINIYCYR